MLPDVSICEAARLSRDARFDGRFFIGVLTTGIYCRPVCPVRPPGAANVRFYASAAAAEAAGYRPCLRCCPELAPEATSADGLVGRALAAIDRGALDEGTLETLAASVDVSARHLNRVLREQTGATAGHFARTRRLHAAKRLINGTRLPFTQVAELAGFRSLRRFNETVRRTWQRSPTQLRALPDTAPARSEPGTLSLRLPLTAPWDGRWVADFLTLRAVPGIEAADEHGYTRSLRVGERAGTVTVHWPAAGASRIALTLRGFETGQVPQLVQGARRLLDLDAQPESIQTALGQDPLLADAIARWPGIRVPGTLDGFELAVRAVLGQQVSVLAARTLTERLVVAFGAPVVDPEQELVLESMHAIGRALPDRLFPTPQALAGVDIAAAVGMPKSRANAIAELGTRTANGEIDFAVGDSETLVAALQAVPGIGPWTAQYVAMRAVGDPDAFIEGDLIVRRMMGFATRDRPRDVLARAQSWRPWRAYAVMLLWRLSHQPEQEPAHNPIEPTADESSKPTGTSARQGGSNGP